VWSASRHITRRANAGRKVGNGAASLFVSVRKPDHSIELRIVGAVVYANISACFTATATIFVRSFRALDLSMKCATRLSQFLVVQDPR